MLIGFICGHSRGHNFDLLRFVMSVEHEVEFFF